MQLEAKQAKYELAKKTFVGNIKHLLMDAIRQNVCLQCLLIKNIFLLAQTKENLNTSDKSCQNASLKT